MKRTCSLCGGKLRDGICTECGMDNSKSDELYKNILNQSDCTNMKFSHVHNNEAAEAYQSPEMNKNREQKKEEQEKTVPKKTKSTKTNTAFQYRPTGAYTSKTFVQSPRKAGKGFLTAIIILVGTAAFIVNGISEGGYTDTTNIAWEEDFDEGIIVDEYDEYEEYNPFEGLTEELNPDGEVWEQELPAGMYVVGVDIPEGAYTLTGEEGSSYGIFDKEHYLSSNERFGAEEGQIVKAENVALFQGAVVCVDGFHPVRFYTENGQTQELGARETNPLTENYEFMGTAVAGEDFPEGTYDVYAVGEDFGVFNFSLDLIRVDYTVPFSFSTLMEKHPTEEYPEYCSVYKNVVLPKGAVLESEHLQLQLVPSTGVTTTDYMSFYDNTY